MKLENLYKADYSELDPNDVNNFLVKHGYDQVVPKDIFERDKIVFVGIRENDAIGQKLAIVTKRKRCMTTFDSYSKTYIKEQRKECRRVWIPEEGRIVTNYF